MVCEQDWEPKEGVFMGKVAANYLRHTSVQSLDIVFASKIQNFILDRSMDKYYTAINGQLVN